MGQGAGGRPREDDVRTFSPPLRQPFKDEHRHEHNHVSPPDHRPTGMRLQRAWSGLLPRRSGLGLAFGTSQTQGAEELGALRLNASYEALAQTRNRPRAEWWRNALTVCVLLART